MVELICSSSGEPHDACRDVVAAAYALWLQFDQRTDDITLIVAFIDHDALGRAPRPLTAEGSGAAGELPADGDGGNVRRLAPSRLSMMSLDEARGIDDAGLILAAAELTLTDGDDGRDVSRPHVRLLGASATGAADEGARGPLSRLVSLSGLEICGKIAAVPPACYVASRLAGHDFTLRVLDKAGLVARGLVGQTRHELRLLSRLSAAGGNKRGGRGGGSHRLQLPLAFIDEGPYLCALYAVRTTLGLRALLDECEDGFDERTARFYAASVALALDDLHSISMLPGGGGGDGAPTVQLLLGCLTPEAVVLDERGYPMLLDLTHARTVPSPAAKPPTLALTSEGGVPTRHRAPELLASDGSQVALLTAPAPVFPLPP